MNHPFQDFSPAERISASHPIGVSPILRAKARVKAAELLKPTAGATNFSASPRFNRLWETPMRQSVR
jgi:hypothetical protein